MIGELERAIADLLADRLVPGPTVSDVVRFGRGAGQPPNRRARVEVQVLQAEASDQLGDDGPERFGDRSTGIRTRPVLWLEGQVQLHVWVRDGERVTRQVLLRAVDEVLLALHDPAVRSGAVFAAASEADGFALDSGLRLRDIENTAMGRCQLRYAFGGRFWPVEQPVAGPPIADDGIQLRLAVLPVGIPTGVVATAGEPPIAVPITLDLRTSGTDAPDVIGARLLGSEPPGNLLATGPSPTEGFVGISGVDGSYLLSYGPPPSVDSPVVARVELQLTGPDRRQIPLGELHIEVVP